MQSAYSGKHSKNTVDKGVWIYGYTYFPWAYMASSHTCQVNWLFFGCERGKILHECMV